MLSDVPFFVVLDRLYGWTTDEHGDKVYEYSISDSSTFRVRLVVASKLLYDKKQIFSVTK